MDDRIKKSNEFDLQKLFETVGNKETDFDSFVNYQYETDMKKISTISELDFILKNLKETLDLVEIAINNNESWAKNETPNKQEKLKTLIQIVETEIKNRN